MNHEWPAAVHKTMIAVDEVTPEAPDLSIITPRPMPQRRPGALTVAAAVLAVLATVGGLAYLFGRDQRDTTSPAATDTQTTLVPPSQQGAACALLIDPSLSPTEQAAVIDNLLRSDPAALDPAELQRCKAATTAQLRRLHALVLERQAALNASSTSAPSTTYALAASPSCDEQDVADAVASAIPGVPPIDRVTVEACRYGYVQLVASRSQAGAEPQRVWMKASAGTWTLLDAGTGISCDPTEASPSITEACVALFPTPPTT